MPQTDSPEMVTYQKDGKIYERRKRREFTNEFKRQIIELHKSGKRRIDLIREYALNETTFDRWVREDKNSGSFHAKDNRTPEQNELIRLQKENKRLKMELDIVKQAALILGERERR